jgi:phage shock protein A
VTVTDNWLEIEALKRTMDNLAGITNVLKGEIADLERRLGNAEADVQQARSEAAAAQARADDAMRHAGGF